LTLGACGKSYSGHGGDVNNVLVTCDGNYLISTGREDRCVIQWRRVTDKPAIAMSNGSVNVDKEVKRELSFSVEKVCTIFVIIIIVVIAVVV